MRTPKPQVAGSSPAAPATLPAHNEGAPDDSGAPFIWALSLLYSNPWQIKRRAVVTESRLSALDLHQSLLLNGYRYSLRDLDVYQGVLRWI